MDVITALLQNKVLIAALLAWTFAQVFKTLIYAIITKKIQLERLWGAGGMPSAHSAMVCALAISTARFYGVDSPVFALSLVLAMVTIYDAMGVRREAGRHAQVLNHLFNGLWKEITNPDENEKFQLDTIDLKELIGHTPLEVFGGILLGVLVGTLLPV